MLGSTSYIVPQRLLSKSFTFLYYVTSSHFYLAFSGLAKGKSDLAFAYHIDYTRSCSYLPFDPLPMPPKAAIDRL